MRQVAHRTEKRYIEIMESAGKALKQGLTALLLFSFVFVIPLISVFHVHAADPMAGTETVRQESQARSFSSPHTNFCEICSRLHSTFTYAEPCIFGGQSIYDYEVIGTPSFTPPHFVLLTSLQGRAPPLVVA
jgi:hypothetical protein